MKLLHISKYLILTYKYLTCAGGSDATVKLWDIGTQKCIQTLSMHSDSVWALAATGDFSRVFSASRDNFVFCSELRSNESTLLFKTNNAPLRLALAPQEDRLWVSTTGSNIEMWDFDACLSRYAHCCMLCINTCELVMCVACFL